MTSALRDTGRAYAETLMTSACVIERRTGELVTDPQTGDVTELRHVVYDGKCRIRPASSTAQATTETIGGEVFRFDYLISVPFAEAAVTEGDRVTVTASADPALIGVEVEVQKVARGDDLTARRLACQEVK